MPTLFSDEYFMKKALEEARAAAEEGEVPVGAIVVAGNRVIARGRNQTERLNDVTAHAEILALTAAAGYLGGKYLKDCTLYVTLEPCVMCGGALAWAQLGRLVFGAADGRRGFCKHEGILHPKTQVTQGILETECADLLKSFFQSKR